MNQEQGRKHPESLPANILIPVMSLDQILFLGID
jgi:hypothetical protein